MLNGLVEHKKKCLLDVSEMTGQDNVLSSNLQTICAYVSVETCDTLVSTQCFPTLNVGYCFYSSVQMR